MDENESGTEQSNAEGETPPAPTTPDPRDEEIKGLQAQLAELDEHKRKLNEENAKRRRDAQAALTEQGEYKALAESLQKEREELRARLDEVAPSVEKAKAYDEFVQAETERISEATKEAPDFIKVAIRSASSLSDKRAILSGFLAMQNGRQPPSGGTPGAAIIPLDESTPEGRAAIRKEWAAHNRTARSTFDPRR